MGDIDTEVMIKYVWQIIVVVFLAGGGWVTMNSLADDVKENSARIEAKEERDDKVDQKLTKLATTQEHIKAELDKQGEKLDAILDELRKRD